MTLPNVPTQARRLGCIEEGRLAVRDNNTTKSVIADAAELLFSQRGFRAATIRDIFTLADVNQGLMAYYFSSKEELYAFTVGRRIVDFRALFLRGLAEIRIGPAVLTPKRVIEYYIRFFLENVFLDAHGIANYVTLLAKSSVDYDNEAIRNVLYELDFLTEEMVGMFAAVAPFVEESQARRTIFYLENAVTSIIINRDLQEHRLGFAPDAGNLAGFIDDMAEFFARGFLR